MRSPQNWRRQRRRHTSPESSRISWDRLMIGPRGIAPEHMVQWLAECGRPAGQERCGGSFYNDLS